MPTIEWLKQEFNYGYDSGDVLTVRPGPERLLEERKIGGSYFNFFQKAVAPRLSPNARVLELGPGRGSWSRGILQMIPEGELHTCDFQDLTNWLKPENYGGRLHCHQVTDNSFSCVQDDFFDVFFSFGVLVHCNQELIEAVLTNAFAKVKPNGVAIHNYGDWGKLDEYGWEKGGVPVDFKNKHDDEIWWPRNAQHQMVEIALRAGWVVEQADMKFFLRDGVILLRKPEV
jgi:hypothetical protein